MIGIQNGTRVLERGALAIALALALGGCLGEQRYIEPETGGPWVFAIDRDTPAFFMDDEISLFLVEERIEIPFREPTAEELAAQGDIGDAQIPYAQMPVMRRGDYELQLDFTLSNLSDARITAGITVNGINEFHEYNPGVQVIDDELVIDFSQWERSFVLGPGERITRSVREEEIDEIAVDLASVVNGTDNPNQIVYFENQSTHDRRSQMFIPDVVPALTGVRVGIRSEAADDMGALPVLVEVTLRVRDRRGVLVQGENELWAAPAPVLFGPADVAPPVMP